MARRYVRDNRGRFASRGGGGATARGGRLRTASGNKRATQTMTAKGAGGTGVMKGRAARTVAGERAMRRLAAPANASKSAPALKPAANLKQNKLGKVAPSAAKQRYKQASSTARAVGGDLRGASPMERRAANSKAAVVKNMERNRSTATASAANSPKAAQRAREVARAKRAQSQYTAGMARETEGPNSKASRKVTVARRAMQIYSGKVDPKAKATARLTRTTDQNKLQDRIRRSAKLKPPKAAKPAAKPAQAKAAPKANDRAMRAAKNYQRAAGAMGRGAMNKRTDVSLATASRALDVYRGKPITGKRSGFTSSGKAAKPTAKPTVYRTRSQAAAAQLDRKRQVAEIGAGLPKVGAAQSLSRRAVKVNQGNLLTGRVEKVTANVTTQKGSSKIGESSFAKKTQRRMERVEGRIDALVSARRSLPQRPRRSADQAAAIKIDRRLSKMSQAADTYRRARPKARRK
jgi:hypothetical protein